MKILVIDNYDSFTFNLVHYLEKVSDASVAVFKNDRITLEEALHYDKILISPGPGLPSESGNLSELITGLKETKDILGICLGLQALVENEGGKLKNLNTVYHGVATPIKIIERDILFDGIPEIIYAGRYHSWVADNDFLPHCFTITAVDEQQLIMAIKHKTKKIRAVQFHPESILTEYGEKLISNWVNSTL